MLSLEETKKILNNPDITDEEALEVRDHFYTLAELVFEKWQQDHKKAHRKPPSKKPS